MLTSKTFIPSLKTFFIALLIFFSLASYAQHDSLILKTGDVIVGEIKSLDKGVVTIETDYSKSDFTIEWSGIKEIYSNTTFLITLKNGERINGTFRSLDTAVIIKSEDGKQTNTVVADIVYLKGLKSNFWGRVHASIDAGLSITKANNLKQYNVRSAVGYLADKWLVELYYDDLRTNQDSVEETKRTEAGGSFTYFLPRDWYLIGAITTLANTEQDLKKRLTAKAGVGKYFIHTNKSYWGVSAGIASNNETFTNGKEKRNSTEGYFGSELNLFDIGDFSLLTNAYVYPNLTESGRWRVDFKLDTKYDLPKDFYVKFGITVNYDNRPAEIGKETDYVYVFSVGWEL
jgi:hypothetical protein